MPTEIALGTVHYDFLKERIPAWFTQASIQRQQELGNHSLQLPEWYAKATPAARAALAASHNQYRETLNTVETRLGAIQDITEFAEPLLKAAIKQQFKLELDVKQVYFARKFGPAGRDDFSRFMDVEHSFGAGLNQRYRGLSLLEAALANFELSEEQPLACRDCQIITAWSSYDDEVIPSFGVLAEHAVAIEAHDFARLCRQLDLGALYQAHIKDVLQPDDASQRRVLEQHARGQLALSVQIADLQRGISATARSMLDRLLSDPTAAILDGRPVTLAALKLFGSVLVGPLLIGPDRKSSNRTERVLVYLPDDPQQPLKEYASSGAFMADLRTRLHSASYRRFFSRFIPLREQGVFFRRFNALYQPAGRSNAASDYPLQAGAARLPLDELSLGANPWTQLREARLRKIFDDARAVAVPTGDEDRIARLDRLLSYFDAVVGVFNLGAFVVPGLGPLMLVVGAAQLCDEAFEGIEAFEVGETREMWAHLASVGLNVAAVGAGAAILPQIHLSSVVEGLQPVTLDNGKQKLWRGDLEPYKAAITLPNDARPDALGLYTHEGQTVLALDGEHYRLRQEPGTGEYRIRHPSRAGAYEPRLVHNGAGAWWHEREQPLTWHGPRLMRRLGPVVEGFSDVELEQIRQVSGIGEDALRRVHVDGTPVPGILLDTVRQFRAYAGAVDVARGIDADALPDNLCAYAATVAVELPGWPGECAIEAFAGPGLSGPSVKYGHADALPGYTLSVSRAELMMGKLPERIAGFLNEVQMDRLVGRYTARDRPARIAAVKGRLLARAEQVRARLMRSLYADQQPMTDAAEALVQRDFKHLPTLVVREMLAALPPMQRAALSRATRLPLDLAQQARRLQQQVRLAHAYEGMYLDALANQDTEALVLNTLPNLPGWSDNLRLEVREGGLSGELRASFGPESGEKKVLVRRAEGRYQAFDDRGQELHGINGLYGALQHALPDAHRNAIGVPHVGQGEQLQALILDKALSREQLRGVLNMRSPVRSFFRSPVRIADKLGYPLSGRGAGTSAATISDRVRRLYPGLTDAQLSDYLQGRDLANDTWLQTLELHYKTFDKQLGQWLREATGQQSWRVRRRINRVIRNAWRNSGRHADVDMAGNYRGQCIVLEGADVGPELATLSPLPANFNHVTGVVLTGCGLTEAGTAFLSTFRKLRQLGLSSNSLQRLPPVIDEMPFLEHLDVSDNSIELTDESIATLRTKSSMQYLTLASNPLTKAPDVAGMGKLDFLFLADCELSEWPSGLFAKPRSRNFILDLRGNLLERIPEVAPGSDRAQVLARTVLSRDEISPEVNQRYSLYSESVGLDPNRVYPPRRIQGSGHWQEGMSTQAWLEKQPIWNALEEAEGAEPFFQELYKLQESSEFENPQSKPHLTARVWQMVEAMAADTDLRDRLFLMALAPTSCVDSGAQLFDAMGVEVLTQQARALPEEPMRTRELLGLAVGKSRMEELGKIANARTAELVEEGFRFPVYDEDLFLVTQYDDAGNARQTIDEVEVHLAYHTGLARLLDLPWQTSIMTFPEPNVTPTHLEEAYKRIEALERGDLLRARINEQPLWAEYMRNEHGAAFQTAKNKIQALTDLLVAQQELSNGKGLTEPTKQALRETISAAGQVLNKPAEQLAEGQVMTDTQYEQEMATLSDAYNQVLDTLTQSAMSRFPVGPLAPWTPELLPQNRK